MFMRFVMKKAILNSGLETADIDYISASANSMPEQDKLETEAIKDVFGPRAYNISVSSIKSMVGEFGPALKEMGLVQ